MITPRITRALNPHKRRNLSIKQIRAGFGGKRRLASLRASNKHSHKARPKAKASNPKKAKRRATAKAKNATKTRIVYRTKYKTRTKNVYVAPPKRKRKANPRRKRRSNPGPYLLTMAPVLGNPQKKRRKANMAKTKRRASAAGRSGKRNPTRRAANRKHYHHRRKSHHRRRRNPALLPAGSPMAWVQKGFGVFIGFSAAKKFPPMLGPSMNSSPYMTLLATLVTASLTSFVAHKFAPPAFAEGVMWGGLGGAFNMAWNTWAPASVSGYWPGVNGMGDFVPGGFPLPQGPVRYVTAAPGVAPNGAQVNVGAFGRAW